MNIHIYIYIVKYIYNLLYTLKFIKHAHNDSISYTDLVFLLHKPVENKTTKLTQVRKGPNFNSFCAAICRSQTCASGDMETNALRPLGTTTSICRTSIRKDPWKILWDVHLNLKNDQLGRNIWKRKLICRISSTDSPSDIKTHRFS